MDRQRIVRHAIAGWPTCFEGTEQRIVPRSSARLPWTHASTSPGDVESRATVCHPMPALPHPDFSGADDGIRTRDPNLGKVVLYQLSHVRVGHHCSYLRNFEKRRSA